MHSAEPSVATQQAPFHATLAALTSLMPTPVIRHSTPKGGQFHKTIKTTPAALASVKDLLCDVEGYVMTADAMCDKYPPKRVDRDP